MSERIYRTIDVYIQPDGIDVDVVSLQDEPYISVVIDNFIKGDPGEQGPPGESPELIWDNILGKPDFANVATSGSYNDLTDKPTALSDFTDDLGSSPTHTHSLYALSAYVTTKIVVEDITALTDEQVNMLVCGDIVVELLENSLDEDDNPLYFFTEYTVVEKEDHGGCSLCNIGNNRIRIVNYTWEDEWVYSSNDFFDIKSQTVSTRLSGYRVNIFEGYVNKITNLQSSVAFDFLDRFSSSKFTKIYYWSFDTGNTPPVVSWPQQIVYWKGGSEPSLKANTHYEIRVVNNFAECLSTDSDTVDVSGKADKVANATNGNFAGLDSNGNLTDSGHKHSDYITSHQDISGKADKCVPATAGNIAKLTAQGNLADGGLLVSDIVTFNNIAAKADIVSNATSGHFAGLDSYGNLTDSGSKASDFIATPSTAGTSGQVLTSDGQGGQSWQTPQSGGVTDVTVGGTSVVSGGVAAVPAIPTVPTISTNIASDATSDTKTTSPKAVKTFVEGKGYGTYSKPSGGIPASDLASGVIPNSVVNATSQQDGTVVLTMVNGDTITIDLNHQHPNYYSKVAETTQPSGGMLPDVTYKLGTLTGATAFSFAAAVSGNVNHYYFTFTSGTTAVVPTWPASITSWDGNCVDSTTGLPVIAASKTYEVSVIDGNAIIKEW